MTLSKPQSLWDRLLNADNILRLMALLVFAAYIQTVTFELVYDDFSLITLNPWLQSVSGLKQIFTHHSWAFVDGYIPARHYRPMFLVWLWLVQNLAGPAPGFFHLFAIFTHLGACVLAYRVALQLLAGDKISSALVALLFGLHPSRVETIGWIAAATESLLALFLLGSFLAYLSARRGERPILWSIVSLLCFVAALLTKESAVLLPVLVIAYEFLLGPSSGGRAKFRYLATFLLANSLIVLSFVYARNTVMQGMADETLRPSVRALFTAPLAACELLRQLVWPVGLSGFYPHIIVAQFSWKYFLAPALLLLFLLSAYLYYARKSAVLQFAAVWFITLLLPILAGFNWIQLHDRHLYLPFFGVAIALVAVVRDIRWPESINPRHATAAVVLGLSIVFAAISAHEVRIWRSSIALFTRAVEKAPANNEAVELLAESYFTTGQKEQALEVLQRGLAASPDSPRLTYALAADLKQMERYSEARFYFERLFTLPSDPLVAPGAHFELGLIEWKQGNLIGAEDHIRQAAELAPSVGSYQLALTRVQKARAEASGSR